MVNLQSLDFATDYIAWDILWHMEAESLQK